MQRKPRRYLLAAILGEMMDLYQSDTISPPARVKIIRRRWIFLAMLAVGVVALSLLALWLLFSRGAQQLEVYWDMPPFSFTDQMGQPLTRDDLQGKVVLANFIFTNCVEFCPTVLSPRMRELQTRLRREGLLGEKVVLLSFSVDPQTDTPEKLRAYAEALGADPTAWHFLTGGEEEMRRVLIEGLKLGVLKTDQPIDHVHPDGSTHRHQYNVAHSNRFVLVDRQGQVRALFDGVVDWDSKQVIGAVHRLAD